mgnify:CR=1 FL=1
MDNKVNNNIPIVAKEYKLYFFLLVFCFALWGLLNNIYASSVYHQKIFVPCRGISRIRFLYDRCFWICTGSTFTEL